MPLVPIRYVVSFTSQDDRYPVSNLLNSGGLKKWLSSPSERSGSVEAVFQLEQPCLISYIDIGSVWCASLEVRVGCSEWPAGREYETLVYTVSLMTPAECTLGKNPIKTQMFSTDIFCPDVAKKKWDRVKIICRQPYKKTAQFGLSFLRVKSSMASGEAEETRPGNKPQAQTGNQTESVSSIKDHFLGKLNVSQNAKNNQLKTKLLKISATSEGGSGGVENDVSLPRTAQLVLAASGPKAKAFGPGSPSSLPDRVGMYSKSVDQKYAPKFETEVDEFLASLTFQPSDLDTITMADVRHKMEKKMKRKLTKEEKRLFIEKTKTYLTSLYSSGASKPGSKPCSPDPASLVKDSSALKENNVQTKNLVRKPGSNNNLDNRISHVISNNFVKGHNPVSQKDPLHQQSTNFSSGARLKSDSGEVTNATKRKLDDSDAVTPPAKKSKTAQSVRQQMKSCEKDSTITAVKNGIANHLQKAFSVIKNVMNQGEDKTMLSESPRTPFQYKGMRRKSILDEDDAGPGAIRTSCAKALSNNVGVGIVKCNDEDLKVVSTNFMTPVNKSGFGTPNTDFSFLLDDSDLDDSVDLDPKPKSQRGKKTSRGRGARRKSGRGGGIKKLDCSDFFLSSDEDDLDLSCDLGVPTVRGRGQTRGRGRGRGRGQKNNTSLNNSTIKDRGISVPQRKPNGFTKCTGCGDYYGVTLLSAHMLRCAAAKKIPQPNDLHLLSKSPKGRGRGKRSSAASLEIRPSGFVKCDGCNEYFGPTLLTIHQEECQLYKSRKPANHIGSYSSPWMCAKPSTFVSSAASQSPKSSSNQTASNTNGKTSKIATNQKGAYTTESQGSSSKAMKSPPWLLAAERRLNQGNKSNTNVLARTPPTKGLPNSSLTNMCSSSSAVLQCQKRELDQLSNQSTNKQTGFSSSARMQTGSSKVASKKPTTSVNNVRRSKSLSAEFVDSSDSDTDSDGGSLPEFNVGSGRKVLDESTIHVECPLCGDFFPSLIIEQHAATCFL